MDIAALASISKYATLRQTIGTAVARLVMDQNESQAQNLVKLMESSVNPGLGSTIDIRI